MRPRLTETDYAIIAVAPALIMVLVASLMLFLAGLFYHGQYEWRLNMVICMFVLGIVSLARLHIEEGILKSIKLGAAFTFVMLFAVWQMAPDALVMATLMLMGIWWISTRLVYDCTVMEQSVDASQKGLMQWIRPIQEEPPPPTSPQPDVQTPIEGVTGTDPEEAKPTTFAEKLDAWFNPTNTKFAPGAWVVYFSLGALPIFGLGQAFASQLAGDRRWYLFMLLVAYVFAALGLLVTTSFLGLRRYLQQRGVVMPLSMTGTWLGVGFSVVLIVLLLVAILPRPNAEYELAKLPTYSEKDDSDASQFSVNDEGTKDNRDDRSGTTENQDQADENSRQSDETREDGKQAGDKTDANAQKSKPGKSNESNSRQSDQKPSDQQQSDQGDSKQSDSQQGESEKGKSDSGDQQSQNSDQQNSQQQQQDSQSQQQDASGEKSDQQSDSNEKQSSDDQKASKSQSPEPKDADAAKPSNSPQQTPAAKPKPFSFLGELFGNLGFYLKMLFYVALAAGMGIGGWAFWDDIAAAWRDFWGSLFGSKPSDEEEQAAEPAPVVKPRVPFSAFRNPFHDAQWKGKPPEEWIRYSVAAVEAWGAERGCERGEDLTLGEFANRLETEHAEFNNTLRRAADIYGQVAYGSGKAPRETGEILRKLWETLRG
ncbi:DUF4129 domain-containing protein [Bremerella sp. JC817]|uniref:DUF4129 domain-containing protein n=1 Tax=Bremerella sp. JC817 TaxID=3231756 RepID=UPI003458A4A3